MSFPDSITISGVRYVRPGPVSSLGDVWYLQPSLVARIGRIKGEGEKEPIDGLPATWTYGSGERWRGDPWRPYYLGLTALLHPELSDSQVEAAVKSVMRNNGGWCNGGGWDNPDGFKPAALSSETNVHRAAVPGDRLLTKNFGGEPYAAFRAMDVHRPRPAPTSLLQVSRWEHFAPTSTGSGYCNLFPTPYVSGRLLLPWFGEYDPAFGFAVQWLKVIYNDKTNGEVGNHLVKVAQPLDPGVPARPQAVAGVPWGG